MVGAITNAGVHRFRGQNVILFVIVSPQFATVAGVTITGLSPTSGNYDPTDLGDYT